MAEQLRIGILVLRHVVVVRHSGKRMAAVDDYLRPLPLVGIAYPSPSSKNLPLTEFHATHT